MWVTRVIMESWCWDEDAGKVSVVMRSGACDSVRSIGRRCARPGTVTAFSLFLEKFCVDFKIINHIPIPIIYHRSVNLDVR